MGLLGKKTYSQEIETSLDLRSLIELIRDSVEDSVSFLEAKAGGWRMEWSALSVADGGVFDGLEAQPDWAASVKKVGRIERAREGAFSIGIRAYDEGEVRVVDMTLEWYKPGFKGKAAKVIESVCARIPA